MHIFLPLTFVKFLPLILEWYKLRSKCYTHKQVYRYYYDLPKTQSCKIRPFLRSPFPHRHNCSAALFWSDVKVTEANKTTWNNLSCFHGVGLSVCAKLCPERKAVYFWKSTDQ
jgi:hypothetical protein